MTTIKLANTRWSIGIWLAMLLLLASSAGPRTAIVKETAAVRAGPMPTIHSAPSPTPESEADVVQILPHSLAWDPSGRWLAYTGVDGRAWLRTRESETPALVKGIHSVAPAELRVAWSPDGSRLLVYGEWGSPRSTGLWLVPVSDEGAGEARPIVAPVEASSPVQQNSGAIAVAAWSPDGKQIAYTFQAEAWIYELDSGQSQRVTGLTEQPLSRSGSTEPFDGVREIAWSPDGRLLAVGLSCNCPSPWSGVGIVDLDSRETRLLVDGGHSVSWSPDGRWIAFQNASGDWTGGSTFDFYGVDPESGEIANLTRSNPGRDPLRPVEGTYRDADYQTANLRWGTGGSFLYETLDYSVEGGVAPARGFVVQGDPVTVLEARFGDEEAWYVFPTWLANGRYTYLEVTPRDSDPQTYAIRQAVVGQQVMPIELAYVRGAAWAIDGSAVALCVANGPGSPSSEVLILTLPLPVLP
jgi:WD40 repeat protein